MDRLKQGLEMWTGITSKIKKTQVQIENTVIIMLALQHFTQTFKNVGIPRAGLFPFFPIDER